MGVFVFCRFELKYFDPFLILDEFSGGLSLFSSVSSFNVFFMRKVSFFLRVCC